MKQIILLIISISILSGTNLFGQQKDDVYIIAGLLYDINIYNSVGLRLSISTQ